MAGPDARAAADAVATSINQEQLFHELEQKYIELKSEFTVCETEKQAIATEKHEAVAELKRVQALASERETELVHAKETLMKVTSEKEQLGFQLKTAQSLAERRLLEIETLQATVKEQTKQLVESQRREMEALQRAGEQEAQVDPLRHSIARLQTEIENSKQHTQWLESQVGEKTKFTQELRQSLSKQTHEYEELKMKYTEEITSTKRQLENARQVSKKLESSLIQSKEQVKEIQAAKVHDEERFQNELSAQRRLAELYKESASDANARVTELQELCDSLRTSLAESDEALALETERTKAQVEHLFQEQTEASEKTIAALDQKLKEANAKIEELEKKKIFSLQTASAVADLSSAAGEAHLAAHGLSPKQMYDHIVELEETLREERTEKERLQLYMDRIVKEVQEKAPIIMGLRLDHERAVASHTQMSERLEVCMQELAKSKNKEEHAWKEKHAFEKKCESLSQTVDDLSRQVQHLLFRSQENRAERIPGDVVSENLVVFKNVEELQARNQQLLTVVRELSEINKQKEHATLLGSEYESSTSSNASAHLIVSGESDDEGDRLDISGRLSQARKEIQELRAEREQERQMIAAIVKQRDMYRVLLAQSDNKFLEPNASNAGSGHATSSHEPAASARSASTRRTSFDVTESRAVRELQAEFDDYKKEKQANAKIIQASLDQVRGELSQAKLAQMQAQVEAKCNKERYEASEARRQDVEDELVRLRSKTEQLSSLLLQHQQLLSDSDAKLEAAVSRAHSLGIEKESAAREAEYLKKNETKLQQELTSVRLDNTNLLKLMESTRRMESVREERDRREAETLVQKVEGLESRLHDSYAKNEEREAIAGANLLAAEQEKKAALTELEKVKKTQVEQNEKLVRLEEQKSAADSKSTLLEKEVTHLREQLRKGASAAAAERVAALEVQLRDAQREVQSSLALRKSLTENVARYKAIAEANEKSLNELSAASEKWKESQEVKLQGLEKERDHFQEELTKSRAMVKEQVLELNKLRDTIDNIEESHKVSLNQALEKQSLALIQAEGSQQEIAALRDEIALLKKDLSSAQENYERELQLHAAEVSKAAASRKHIEELQNKKQELFGEVLDLKAKVANVDQEAHEHLENLRKELQEVTEAKDVLSQQNKLLHSQLERAASQVRRAHEQELMKNAIEKRQETGEEGKTDGDGATNVQHNKEVDDLRSVIAFLRRESEISVSKLDLAQQETQRYRAQVLSLESTVERLRDEIKTVSSNGDKQGGSETTSNAPSEAAKRVAQLEQLSLLRESNATLRDESQKYLVKLKEEEAKVKALEDQLTPLRNSEASLKTLVASLKQEIVTLNDANKRWKQRVEQLVEKYQQVDPAEHDKVVSEKEALAKEVAELKANQTTLQSELDTLRSSEGKLLEEEKTKVENWKKQYDRIKGFAKTWKTKAETFSKQLADKTKEADDKSNVVTELETKVKVLENTKLSLEARVAAVESSKQDSGEAAATVTAQFEKERQDWKDRLEAEQKKNTQLKDFNSRLMTGLKSLKKENTELKGQAAAPSLSPSPSPSPIPTAPAEPQGTKVEEATPSTTEATSAPTTSAPAVVTTTAPKVVSTFQPPLPPTPAPPLPVTSVTASSKPVVNAPAAPPAVAETAKPVVSTVVSSASTTVAPVVPATSSAASTSGASFATFKVVTSNTSSTVSQSSITTTTTPTTSTTTSASTSAADSSTTKPIETKETTTAVTPAGNVTAPSAEDKLRLFALQSMKKQAANLAKPTTAAASSGLVGTPSKLVLNASTTPVKLPPKPATASATSEEDALKAQLASSGPFLKLSPPTGAFGAFGSGGASGLVFGKPGITLPIPASPTPVGIPVPTISAAGSTSSVTTTVTSVTSSAPVPPDAAASAAPVESEAQRRSQRLARFAAQAGTAPPPLTPPLGPASGNLLAKRPASGSIDVDTPQKIARTGEGTESNADNAAQQEETKQDGNEGNNAAGEADVPSTPPTQPE
ncbi:Nuclear mitotic apparatus protein, partial [Globisporangium splendens]